MIEMVKVIAGCDRVVVGGGDDRNCISGVSERTLRYENK